jgi:DNA-binding NarL/FixJ family response regulator
VLVADDHDHARRYVRGLLEHEERVELIPETRTTGTVERQLEEHLPRVLVLELGRYDGAAIAHLKQLVKAAPHTRVVVLTMDDDPAFALHALDAGASAFVLAETADTDLPEAIARAAQDEEFVSPRLSAALQALGRSLTEDTLTARETEVLRLIALGYTSVEVAQRLRLSPRTVETHRARIYRKLRVSTRAQVVSYALGRGLLGA